jgi:hypothetical protein
MENLTDYIIPLDGEMELGVKLEKYTDEDIYEFSCNIYLCGTIISKQEITFNKQQSKEIRECLIQTIAKL